MSIPSIKITDEEGRLTDFPLELDTVSEPRVPTPPVLSRPQPDLYQSSNGGLAYVLEWMNKLPIPRGSKPKLQLSKWDDADLGVSKKLLVLVYFCASCLLRSSLITRVHTRYLPFACVQKIPAPSPTNMSVILCTGKLLPPQICLRSADIDLLRT